MLLKTVYRLTGNCGNGMRGVVQPYASLCSEECGIEGEQTVRRLRRYLMQA